MSETAGRDTSLGVRVRRIHRRDLKRIAHTPSFTQEPDGTVRVDVCEECTAQSETIRACSQLAVDPLH